MLLCYEIRNANALFYAGTLTLHVTFSDVGKRLPKLARRQDPASVRISPLEGGSARRRWGAAARVATGAPNSTLANKAFDEALLTAIRRKHKSDLPPLGYQLPGEQALEMQEKPMWDTGEPQWQYLSQCLSSETRPARSLLR